ncbi:hypothetical protein LA080_004643 [Diaporthe eres]|uniref:Rhodopsin domain-containing protein n=1 Tax=Diaporthe vaccinii TaxID=105482 RepID=A0ABR4E6S6_9PEZI|nr:hypothetical protein LA080_004643 [Diaporthe eres]
MSNIGGSGGPNVNHALDGQSQVTFIVSILSLATVISTAVVVLRIFTRARILRTFGLDDAVMGVAQILTIGAAVAIGLETKWGLGRHVWIMLPENYTPYMKAFYASVVVYNVATCVVKMSILLQYRRIFTGPAMQKLTMAGLAFEGAWALTLSILLPLVCNPVSNFWDPDVPGKCLNQLAIWYVMASINLVSDFVIFSMPLPVIKNLQLPKKQKIMLMGVFCLGFLTCIISIYRMKTLKVAGESTDPSWDNTDAAVWSFIELSIGVLAACLPTLRPLFALILPRFFKSTVSGRTGQYNGLSGKSTGKMYNRSRTGNTAVKSVYPTDGDSDTDALRGNGSRGSGGGLELPIMYNVTVTGGKKGSRESEMPATRSDSLAGIQTTTVVTQRVDSL